MKNFIFFALNMLKFIVAICLLILMSPQVLYAKDAPKNNSKEIFQKGLLQLQQGNPAQANIFFAAAAKLNLPQAIKALADSYFSGDGLKQNKSKALLLYVKAADLSYGPAQFSAGILLSNGELGFYNFPLSFYYLCLASINKDLELLRDDAKYYRNHVYNLLSEKQKNDLYKSFKTSPFFHTDHP